jgi:hypothetical protein
MPIVLVIGTFITYMGGDRIAKVEINMAKQTNASCCMKRGISNGMPRRVWRGTREVYPRY